MAPGGTGPRRRAARTRTRTRAARASASAATLALAASMLGGCSQGVDLAHGVQTRLGRVDGVVGATVTAPSDAQAPRIVLQVDPGLQPADLVLLVREVGRVAAREKYAGYRLDLEPADAEDDVLVVDDGFDGRDDELAVLDNWHAVTQALLGPVTYTFQDGVETIAVASDGGVLHDATEASRIRYGGTATTWRFASGPSTLLVAGRVSRQDVEMLRRIQRGSASSDLPVAATSWRLERRRGHVLLALQVGLPESVAPDRTTLARYAADLRPLVRAGLDAVAVGRRPVWLQLRHATATGDDVLGYWVEGQHPVHGRDRLDRGWDRWLATEAAATER